MNYNEPRSNPPILIARQSPQNKFEFFERGWRVALAWILIITIAIPFCAMIAIVCWAIGLGFLKSIETGQPMPDLTAGLDRILQQIMPYVGPGLAGLFALMLSRHREVNTQLGGAQNNAAPFVQPSSPHSPSEASPTGGLVNNNALGGSS